MHRRHSKHFELRTLIAGESGKVGDIACNDSARGSCDDKTDYRPNKNGKQGVLRFHTPKVRQG
jgi:hypothetical protein